MAGATGVWLVMLLLVFRRTIGGDCRTFWVPADVRLDAGGGLPIDPNSCRLTGPGTLAVWVTAVAMAVLVALAAKRLMGARR